MQSYINTNEPSSDEHGSLSSGCLALDLEVGKNDGIIHAFGAVRADTGRREVHSGGGLARRWRASMIAPTAPPSSSATT